MQVNEIFRSIQGESSRAGRPCVFVRLAGCNLRCRYCDTEYARDPDSGTEMGVDRIVAQVGALAQGGLVAVTGGEPLLQADTPLLCRRLRDEGYAVMLETNGSIRPKAVPAGVIMIVDVKCPSSGMDDQVRWEIFSEMAKEDELKFVLGGREDFDWAVEVCRRYELTEKFPVHFQPVFGETDPGELAQWILDSGLDLRLSLQLHKIIWGADARGV